MTLLLVDIISTSSYIIEVKVFARAPITIVFVFDCHLGDVLVELPSRFVLPKAVLKQSFLLHFSFLVDPGSTKQLHSIIALMLLNLASGGVAAHFFDLWREREMSVRILSHYHIHIVRFKWSRRWVEVLGRSPLPTLVQRVVVLATMVPLTTIVRPLLRPQSVVSNLRI